MNSILIQKGKEYIEFPIKDELNLSRSFRYSINAKAPYRFRQSDERLVLLTNKDQTEMIPYEFLQLDDESQAMYFRDAKRTFEYDSGKAVEIGSGEHCDIRLKTGNRTDFIVETDRLLMCSDIPVYLNGQLVDGGAAPYSFGDVIFAGGVKIIVYQDYILVSGGEDRCEAALYPCILHTKEADELRTYKRSPRIIRRVPDDDVHIIAPQPRPKNKKGQLAKLLLPPAVMAAITVLVSMVNPTGIYVLMSVAGMAVSLIVSVTGYINDKRDGKQDEEKRVRGYSSYLLDVRRRLNVLYHKQADAMTYNAPAIKDIEKMILNYSDRIYERSIFDEDFLDVSVGVGNAPSSYRVKPLDEKVQEDEDELMEEARAVYGLYATVPDMPKAVNLKKAHLGLVGDKKHLHEQLNLLFLQIAFSQSYHDVEIIFVYDGAKYKDEFSWLYWLPHMKNHALNVTGMVGDERTRDQVLGSLTKIIKERGVKQSEQKKEAVFSPHYVFVIDEPTLIMDHSIMEYLQRPDTDLGFSLIYTSKQRGNIPENIKTVVILRDSETGILELAYGDEVSEPIRLNRAGSTNFETLSRNLAGLVHQKGVISQIPESVTFYDMYGIKDVEELNIQKRWKENSAHKTLAVPLGLRSEDDIVELNLHEKAHGPHGLIAGTTGSGKSEIVQSYIASLAVNFHPHEVGFLLIDYKGGGMAGLFENLPHLLGTMTNLDGAQSMRAMASIKRELARRQEVFGEHGVNHINQYNKLFRAGKASQPLPHLFLISDEFAELKKEQPEFMTELVSAARIGRSLGVHLILATQKPTGVVDDQIWSNSKFKLCLKVQDESDSNEIIKTPDAAGITLPGRAYLQVGNNEIYELFQSAYSGAKIQLEGKKQVVDDRVYVLNSLRQGMLLNEDLSEADTRQSDMTQLEAVVSHIKDQYDKMDCVDVMKPWLPPLESLMVSPHINGDSVGVLSEIPDINAEVAVGLVDIPEKQAQVEYTIDFQKDGNLAVFSASGYGKSTTLATIMISLAVKNNPRNIRFYILDFGNASLIQMQGLPHTADYIMFDETEKLSKLTKLLNTEMTARKKLFAAQKAANFRMYNEVAGEKLPAIFIVVDNFDVVKEMGFEAEDFFTKLSRDGAGVGIYCIISATRPGAVKYAAINNFKSKIVHYLIDAADVIGLIGRPPYSMGEKKGAAYVKMEDVNIMQVYTAVDFTDDISYSNNIGNVARKIANACGGYRNAGIRMLPEEIRHEDMPQYGQFDPNTSLAVGVSTEEVALESLDLYAGPILFLGGAASGKTNLLKLAALQLKERANIYLFDSVTMELGDFAAGTGAEYIDGKQRAQQALAELQQKVVHRREEYEKAKQQSEKRPPKQYYAALSKIVLLIEDVDRFIGYVNELPSSEADAFVAGLLQVGVIIIATASSSKLKGYDNATRVFKDTIQSVILGNPNDQATLPCPHVRSHKEGAAFGFKYDKGNITQIQIPKV
jgi:S-DNA-T family DNA segregation ATPase FtsK/SpoIIIE